MRRDVHDLQPSAVVLEFIGNNVTNCMQGPHGRLTGDALVQKYREDARTATDDLRPRRRPRVLDGRAGGDTPEADDFTRVREGYEADSRRMTFPTPPLPRVRYVDAGQAVLDGGRFTETLSCLPAESAAEGYADGRIRVRALDGVHFCPLRTRLGEDRCSVYSSGAARFGFAMAEAVRRRLGL